VEALEQLLAKFVTKEAYPEFVDGGDNDKFIDMATAETQARTALAFATSVPVAQ
jgi:hypothetical protein